MEIPTNQKYERLRQARELYRAMRNEFNKNKPELARVELARVGTPSSTPFTEPQEITAFLSFVSAKLHKRTISRLKRKAQQG